MAIKKTARQLRSEQNLLRITQAASDLFSEYGFERVTIDDICQAAQVSKSTFYLHFANKQDLLMSYAKEDRNRYICAHYSYSDSVPFAELLRQFFHVNFDYNHQADRAWNRDAYISYIKTYRQEWQADNSYLIALRELVERGMREDAFRQRLTAEEHLHYIHDWIIGFLIGWSLYPDGTPGVEETYRRIMDTMLANLLKEE